MAEPQVDIWIAFGMGKNFRFYSINAICSSLGEAKSRALPVFHSVTGCDTVSAFKGKGKKSAWQAWQAYEQVTDTFVYLANHPFEHLYTDSDHFKKIERLAILYDRTSHLSCVNEAREEIFCQSYGQNTTHTRCTASTYSTGTVSSWNLDNLHTGAANNSLPRRIWLDYGVRALGASVDYTSRGFKSMQ